MDREIPEPMQDKVQLCAASRQRRRFHVNGTCSAHAACGDRKTSNKTTTINDGVAFTDTEITIEVFLAHMFVKAIPENEQLNVVEVASF
jgi:hypothetical protein